MDDFAHDEESADVATLFAELDRPPTERGDAQRRGRRFERLIRLVLDREGLEPTPNRRPPGEEIDGAFTFDHRTFLLEAKWRKDAIPASDLYAFKGKVDGKLVGTLGVVLSMSGYSEDAIDALLAGKELNIILFNKADFRLVVDGKTTFAEAMRRKLRYASEYGGPFLPLEEAAVVTPRQSKRPHARSAAGAAPRRFDFIVEGNSDQLAFEVIFERLNLRDVLDLHFWVAGGKLNVPLLALKRADEQPSRRVVAVVDEDHVNLAVNERIRSSLTGTPITLLFLRPNLETWLLTGFPENAAGEVGQFGRRDFAKHLADAADLDQLGRTNPDFHRLLRELTGA